MGIRAGRIPVCLDKLIVWIIPKCVFQSRFHVFVELMGFGAFYLEIFLLRDHFARRLPQLRLNRFPQKYHDWHL